MSAHRAGHVAEVQYAPGTDRICGIAAEHDLTSRRFEKLFGHMGILTSADSSANAVAWYAGLPSTLFLDQLLERPIVLPGDALLASEEDDVRFCVDNSAFDMVSGPLDNSSPDAWRYLNGLPLLLWHVRFGLAGGDAASAAAFLRWLACVVQRRSRSGATRLRALWIEGPAGCGKSRFVNGVPGTLFGAYYQRGKNDFQRSDRLEVGQANFALCHYELSGDLRGADIKALVSPPRRLQVGGQAHACRGGQEGFRHHLHARGDRRRHCGYGEHQFARTGVAAPSQRRVRGGLARTHRAGEGGVLQQVGGRRG